VVKILDTQSKDRGFESVFVDRALGKFCHPLLVRVTQLYNSRQLLQ